jgi:hypothetical protein
LLLKLDANGEPENPKSRTLQKLHVYHDPGTRNRDANKNENEAGTSQN